jgi:hypothetical protein
MKTIFVKWGAVTAYLALAGVASAAAVISPALVQRLATAGADEFVPVTFVLDGALAPEALEAMTAGLDKKAARELVRSLAKERAAESQQELLAALEEAEGRGLARGVKPLWVPNVVAAEVRASDLTTFVTFERVIRINLDADHLVTCALAWGVAKVGADRVWDELHVNGEGVVVAVTDTGVDYEHTDLRKRDWVNADEVPDNGIDDDDNGYVDDYHGWNTYDGSKETLGGANGHGSHCAGTVCGDGTAGTQTGVAPGALVMPVKVLSDSGYGNESAAWEGMQYAFDNGADVTSMSLGWTKTMNPDRAMWRQTCETLIAGGMVYAIAAGNERRYGSLPAPYNIRTPGNVPAVITVGATTQDDVYVYFSSYGPVTWQDVPPWNDYPYPPGLTKPDVCAPGYQVTSVCGITGGYSEKNGTSMATPHVAGLAALVLQVDPKLTNAEVRNWMEDYALDLGAEGKDNDYGSGRIRCYETISAMQATPVTIRSFTAEAIREGIRVRWATSSEKMRAGFNLYRRAVSEGEGLSARADAALSYEKLNDDLIKGRSPYVYDDGAVEAGTRYEYLLEVVDVIGRAYTHGPVQVRAGGKALPVTYWLAQSRPNPARERTVVGFGLAEGFAGRAVIEVYDLSGRRVRTPVDGAYRAGVYEVAIDTASLVPGVYIYRMSAGPFLAAKRMVVTR